MIYSLDTNLFVSILRGKSEAARDHLASFSPADIKVSEVVRAELIFGCLRSARPEKNRTLVDAILAPFERLPFAGDAVEHYASIRADLKSRGQTIGPNDLMIAATARAAGAVMVTQNLSEFSRVPGLVVDDWTAS